MILDDEVWEDYVIKNSDIEAIPVKNNRGRVLNNLCIYKQEHENILLMYPGTGGSASVIDLELLIASGIEKIVAFGTCGAMVNNIPKNTFIIPSSAVERRRC